MSKVSILTEFCTSKIFKIAFLTDSKALNFDFGKIHVFHQIVQNPEPQELTKMVLFEIPTVAKLISRKNLSIRKGCLFHKVVKNFMIQGKNLQILSVEIHGFFCHSDFYVKLNS